MKNILILLCFIYSSCYLYSSELTFPMPVDLGDVLVKLRLYNYFEIENKTKDTFFIKSIGIFTKYDYHIDFQGNGLYSTAIWQDLNYSPKIILPNEKRVISYEVQSSFEDSVSLSGGKLNTGFRIEYHKYNNDSLQIGYVSISFAVKKIKNKILGDLGGLTISAFRCPGSQYFLNQGYISFFNTFDKAIKADSVKYWGGDSIVNFYGIINHLHPNIGYPKIQYDSLPYTAKSNSSVNVGWFAKDIGVPYSKKVFLNVYVTDPNNQHIVLFDSIYVNFNSEHGALIENIDNSLKAKQNQKLVKNEKIFISTCSFNSHTLDSITQVGWGSSEFKIYSPVGSFPLKLESGFDYPINYEITPNKVGEVIGKFIAYFRDENNQYYYRYLVMKITTTGTDNVELSTENPLAFYPNPASSLATLLLNEEPQVGEEVQIYNSLGILVSAFEVVGKQTQVNTEKFADGIYLARLLRSGKSVKFSVVR